MAENNEMGSELKKIIKSKKITVGTKNTVKSLRQGLLNKVFITKNCPDSVKSEINSFAKINNINIEQIDYSNEELGIICKKPFSISILGLIK